jgi:hypothetical protein
MTWNHRVVKFDHDWLSICEVYYDKDGEVEFHTADGVRVGSESIDGLRWTLEKMLESLDEPILNEFKEEKTCPPCHGNCNQGRNCPAR